MYANAILTSYVQSAIAASTSPLTLHSGTLPSWALYHRLNSRAYVLGNGQGASDHEAIRMPSMHIARSGSTNGTQEYPVGHREVRIDVNRLVSSVSTAQLFYTSTIELSDARAAGLPC